jgi:hypothetical protein
LINLTKNTSKSQLEYSGLVFFTAITIIHESSYWKHFNREINDVNKCIIKQSAILESTKTLTNLEEDDGQEGYFFVKLIVGGTLRLDYETLDLTIDAEDRSMTISSPLSNEIGDNAIYNRKVLNDQRSNVKYPNTSIKDPCPSNVLLQLTCRLASEYKLTERNSSSSESSGSEEENISEPELERKIMITPSITNNCSFAIQLPPSDLDLLNNSNLELYKICDDSQKENINPRNICRKRRYCIEDFGLVDVGLNKTLIYKECELSKIFTLDDECYELRACLDEYIRSTRTNVKSNQVFLYDFTMVKMRQNKDKLPNSEFNEMSIEMPKNPNLAICMRYFYELDSEDDSEDDREEDSEEED